MKTSLAFFILALTCLLRAGAADPPVPVFQAAPAPEPAAPPSAPPVAEPTPVVSSATPVPPPAQSPKRSAAELEVLVAPIALYPDPLLATMLPASVYPLEIVQAARFVADTNNIAKLDAQPWDKSVKDVARVPDAIKKLNEDLSWTIELGEAFLAQDKEILDAIQAMRSKAQKAGTLQSNPQQVVVVTNMLIEKTVEQQVVVVTNTVVQIQPSSPSVVYVPSYNPYTVYYPPPAYVYNPIAPLVTFTAGVAMGAIIANNCNWYGGGCYHGGDVDIDIDKNVNRNVNREGGAGTRPSTTGKKWQPDQSRLGKSGSPTASASARNASARGWNTAGTQPSAANRAAGPSTRPAGTRPSTGTAGARPSTGNSSYNRPTPSTGASRSPSSASSRPSASPQRSSSGSAYGGMSSGSSARSSSSRGNSSRSGGFSGGSRGGGGRGGGGGGRR